MDDHSYNEDAIPRSRRDKCGKSLGNSLKTGPKTLVPSLLIRRTRPQTGGRIMRRSFPVSVVLALVLLVLSTAPAVAQTIKSPDFLFGKPRGTVGVRSGWIFASANS